MHSDSDGSRSSKQAPPQQGGGAAESSLGVLKTPTQQSIIGGVGKNTQRESQCKGDTIDAIIKTGWGC